MSDNKREQGLYDKYIVRRRDGMDMTGGKHDGCEYFVLDLTHDPHAVPAVRAYVESCERDGYYALAKDLRSLIQQLSEPHISQTPAQESGTSFPAVAAGASETERERLVQWCEEQVSLQQEKMRQAQEVVTIYATEHVQGATLGPDTDEVAMRSGYANNFWQIAVLLRATPAAPVGAPSEAQIAQAWEDYDARVVETDRMEGASVTPGDAREVYGRRDAARARLTSLLSPSLPPVEGAGEKRQIHGVAWLLVRDGAVLLERCPKKARVLGVGEWFVPGGKIEPADETPGMALLREIAEEWPWADVCNFRELPLIEGSPVPPGPKGLFLMRPYVVSVEGTPDACTPEGIPLRWTPIAEALASPVPQVRMMVAAAVDRESRGAGEKVAAASDRDAARWRAVREKAGRVWLNHLKPVLSRYELPYLDADTFATPDEYADALLAQQAPQEGPHP